MTETIPEGWSLLKVKEVIDYQKGRKPPEELEENAEGYFPYLTTDYLRNGSCSRYAKDHPKNVNVEKGEILLLWDGSNAGEIFEAKKGVLASTMVKFSLKKKHSVNFLLYQFKTIEPKLRRLAQGTGIPHVDKTYLNTREIYCPEDIREQEKIALILSKVDEQIQLTEKIIDKTEEVKKGLMQELLTKGIEHTEFKEIKILAHTYKIPASWNISEINEVLELLTDFEANGSFADVKANVNVSDTKSYAWYVRATDLEKKSSLDKVKYVDEHSYNFLRKTKLFGEEVLITKRGEIGKVYQVPKIDIPMTVAPNTYLLKLNKKVEPAYMYYFFKSIYGQRELKAINRSTTIGAIYKDDVKYLLKLPLPSIKEQNKIAKMFLKMDNTINKEVEELEKLTELKKGLMQDLLSGKVRVKV